MHGINCKAVDLAAVCGSYITGMLLLVCALVSFTKSTIYRPLTPPPTRRQSEPSTQYEGWNRGQGSATACDRSTRCIHFRGRLARRRWSADKLSFVAFWGCGDVSRSGWHAISKNGRGEMRTAWVEVREGPAASPEISQVVRVSILEASI